MSKRLQFIHDVALTWTSDECLTWPFHPGPKGRGRVVVNGKETYPSRYVCILAHGEPPSPGLHAAHSCGNGHLGCVNPNHLRWATPKENAHDTLIHGNRPSRHGPNNGRAVLTIEDVRVIRKAWPNPKLGTIAALGRKFGVSRRTIRSIMVGETWSEVP